MLANNKTMRSVALAALVLTTVVTGAVQAAGVRWQTDLEAAKRQAAQSGKLVLLHFWTPSCGPCLRLENTVFSLDSVSQAVEANYVPVKLNANDFPSTATQYKIRSVPTDIILAPDGRIVGMLASREERMRVNTAQGFVAEIGRIASAQRMAAPAVVAARPTQVPGQPNGYGAVAAGMPSMANAVARGPNAVARGPNAVARGAVPPVANPYAQFGQRASMTNPVLPGNMNSRIPNAQTPGVPAPRVPVNTQQVPNPAIPGAAATNARIPNFQPNSRIPGVALPAGAASQIPNHAAMKHGLTNQGTTMANGHANQGAARASSATNATTNAVNNQYTQVGASVNRVGTEMQRGLMPGQANIPNVAANPYASRPVAKTPVAAPAYGQYPQNVQPRMGGTGAGVPARNMIPGTYAPNATGQGSVPQAAVNPTLGAVAPSSMGAPAGNLQLGLEGYCPITLQNKNVPGKQRWRKGDPRWGVTHQGRTYLFSGPTEQQAFLADPERYAPVLSGADSVVALESGRSIRGARKHGVVYNNRVYLFSSEQSLTRFSQDPNRYATGVRQAMQGQTRR